MTDSITPNLELLDDPRCRSIILDGVAWPVPMLAPAQNEVVVPIILARIPDILRALRRPDAISADQPPGREAMEDNFDRLSRILSPEVLRDLYTVVYMALKRGHKGLTRAQFDEDFSCGVLDTIESVLTISRQTGVIRQASAGETPPKGEA